MIRNILIYLIVLSAFQYCFGDSTAVSPMAVPHENITARANITYVPINSIEFTNRDNTYDVYDNLFYRLALEYHISNLISIGPSLEFMKRKVEPDAIFHKQITAYNILVDSKLKHNLIDSGNSRMTFGFGVGVMSLKEETGQSGKGAIFYAATGLDIGIWDNVGLDFIYRYQLSHVDIEYRKYRYDGSSIQMGINYRIRF